MAHAPGVSDGEALDRSAPMLALLPGLPERHPPDYVRNGTTNLYAALDVASGQVITDMTPRHRAEELRRFLNLIERSVPAHLHVHVVLDTSSTHKTPGDPALADPPPALHADYSSWLNLVERWFAELTTRWIKRSADRSVGDLVASIRTWTTNWNPKPYVWQKTADEILDSPPPTANESPTQITRSGKVSADRDWIAVSASV